MLIDGLLSHGAQPTARDKRGWSAFHLACWHNQPGVVRRLLQVVEVEQQLEMATSNGQTALGIACGKGADRVVPLLLAAGADVHAMAPCGLRPLHAAVIKQHLSVVALLLAAGADPCAVDQDNLNALHFAARAGRLDKFQALLAVLVAAQRRNHVDATWKGITALHLAVAQGHTSCVEALLAAGADPNKPCGAEAVDSNGISAAGMGPLYAAVVASNAGAIRLLANPTSLCHTWKGLTPLQCAAACRHTAVVRRLLAVQEVAADVDAATPDGRTPLFLACYEGADEAVSLLLAAGADVRMATDNGHTPVYAATHAAKHGRGLSALQQVLAAGGDPGAAGKDGRTALHCVAAVGQLAALQALLAAMAAGQGTSSLDALTQGRSALHMAIANGNTSCVEALLAAGADPDQLHGAGAEDGHGSSLEGMNPLYRAVQLVHHSIVPLLATPVNLHQTWEGQTPLHMALDAEDAVMAAALVAAGAPAGVPDPDGATPMSWAAATSNAGLWKLLPAMVRGECERYKQLLKDREATHQQQQQLEEEQRQAEEEEEEDPAAELHHVIDSVGSLLEVTAAGGASAPTDALTGCFRVFLEVLGPAAASDLLQKLLDTCNVLEDSDAIVSCYLKLLRAVHSGWVAGLEPLMNKRHGVIKTLQYMVALPLQKQLQPKVPRAPGGGGRGRGAAAGGRGRGAAAGGRGRGRGGAAGGRGRGRGGASGGRGRGMWQAPEGGRGWGRGPNGREFKFADYDGPAYTGPWGVTWAQVTAAGDAGDWQLVVQHLESLRNESDEGPESSGTLYTVAAQKGWVCKPAAVEGLCGALLQAWEVARHKVPGKVHQELKAAVVTAATLREQKLAAVLAGSAIKRRRRW
jgi:ankyrin repeat protein/uncharacterized membrane protein YgcG